MLKNLRYILLAISLCTLVSVTALAQQGNGQGSRGNGASMGNQTTLIDPQMNAYQNGGLGFINPQTGEQWNGQQRGKMNRGTGINGTGFYTSLPPATTATLPDDIVALMIDGWEDENIAWSVYEGVMTSFGEIAPFSNIQLAEAQHIASWEFLFDRYGIVTPVFEAPALPTFTTLAEACQAGANAEIANFALYDTMLEAFIPYPDLYQVALALRNASEFNHLPAFQSCSQ